MDKLKNKILNILKESEEEENLFKPRRLEDREEKTRKELEDLQKQYPVGVIIDIYMYHFVENNEFVKIGTGKIIEKVSRNDSISEDPMSKAMVTVNNKEKRKYIFYNKELNIWRITFVASLDRF
jgi:hypothetical protein